VHTRTGRSFLSAALTEELLQAVRTAVADAGLWSELDTDWLLLDAELLPWSAKAEDLLRSQYAAVGAAAGAALPVAVAALQAASARGVDVADLLARTASRAGNARAFTDAYRRYVWPTAGLEGVQLAPFQLLASEGRTWTERDHGWHLALADRLVEAAPTLMRPTRWLLVDTSDPTSTRAAVAWWEDLTGSGGEGMVVKPFANLVSSGRGWAQPGIKVRGREYLRIIYGPDYTEPANLERLRDRNLGHKRSLAAREYALGVESLERAVRGEPLWRVHEAVFAVLALESEPSTPACERTADPASGPVARREQRRRSRRAPAQGVVTGVSTPGCPTGTTGLVGPSSPASVRGRRDAELGGPVRDLPVPLHLSRFRGRVPAATLIRRSGSVSSRMGRAASPSGPTA
jgi:protein phosphatase